MTLERAIDDHLPPPWILYVILVAELIWIAFTLGAISGGMDCGS